MIRIRQSTDLAAVRILDSMFFPKTPVSFEETRKAEAPIWWIAYDGDKPIGYAGLSKLKTEPGVFFCRAGVIEGYRGRGIHRRLIRVRIRWARRHKLYALTYTAKWNTKSANNLIDLGFRIIYPAYEWGIPKKSIYFCLE